MAITKVQSGDTRILKEIANRLGKAKKVVMVTGAGISTNCGIPDFRSKEGLYTLIHSNSQASSSSKTKDVKGKDLFDASLWNCPVKTATFYKFIAAFRHKVKKDVTHPTAVHKLIRTLRDRRVLVRGFTQNIDSLESRDDLSTDLERGVGSRARFARKSLVLPYEDTYLLPGEALDSGCEVVQLHGDLDSLRCTICPKSSDWDEAGVEACFRRGEAPPCPHCTKESNSRRAQGKRSSAVGTLRPNVILYGEEHPAGEKIAKYVANDVKLKPDVLLIFGTSLQVHGLKRLVKDFSAAVHAKRAGRVVFINNTPPAESVWASSIDYHVGMDTDAFVTSIRQHRPDIWQQQTSIEASRLKKATQAAGEGPKATNQKAAQAAAPGPAALDRGANQAEALVPRVLTEKTSQAAAQAQKSLDKTATKALANGLRAIDKKASHAEEQATGVLSQKPQYDEKENAQPAPATPSRNFLGTALTPTSTLKASRTALEVATPLRRIPPLSYSASTLQASQNRERPRNVLSTVKGSAGNPAKLSAPPYLTPPPSKHNGSQRGNQSLDSTNGRADGECSRKRRRMEYFEIHEDEGGAQDSSPSPTPKRRRRLR